MARARVYRGRAVTLRHEPSDGPPSAPATFGLYDLTNTAVVAEQPATVGSVATTLTATARAGERLVALTALTNIVVGQAYWVGANETPATRERVVVRRQTDTLELELVDPLRFDHDITGPNTQRFLDGSISIELDAGDMTLPVAALYRMEWTWELDGEPQYATRYLDVVLRRFQLQWDEEEYRLRVPREVREALRGEYEAGELERAAEKDVLAWLRGNNYPDPDRVLDPEQFSKLGIYAAKIILLDRIVSSGNAAFKTALDDARKQYVTEGDQILRTGVALLDEDGDLVGDDGELNVQRVGRGPSRILGALR